MNFTLELKKKMSFAKFTPAPQINVHLSFRHYGDFMFGQHCAGGRVVDLQACVSSLFPACRKKNNTGTSFHITQVGLQSLGGF